MYVYMCICVRLRVCLFVFVFVHVLTCERNSVSYRRNSSPQLTSAHLSCTLLSSQQPLSRINWHLHLKHLLTSSCLILIYYTLRHYSLIIVSSLDHSHSPKLYCRTHSFFGCQTIRYRHLIPHLWRFSFRLCIEPNIFLSAI